MTRGTIVALLLLLPIMAVPVFAGNPHFITCSLVGATADSITVAAKEAGLGDELQIEAELTATALCINGGGNHPKAVNKSDVATAPVIPVQNGKASYVLSGIAQFQPDCSPPMTVSFTDILITDLTNGLTNGLTCTP